jgi:hypothetical protein
MDQRKRKLLLEAKTQARRKKGTPTVIKGGITSGVIGGVGKKKETDKSEKKKEKKGYKKSPFQLQRRGFFAKLLSYYKQFGSVSLLENCFLGQLEKNLLQSMVIYLWSHCSLSILSPLLHLIATAQKPTSLLSILTSTTTEQLGPCQRFQFEELPQDLFSYPLSQVFLFDVFFSFFKLFVRKTRY